MAQIHKKGTLLREISQAEPESLDKIYALWQASRAYAQGLEKK